jgi:hypothetical protein
MMEMPARNANPTACAGDDGDFVCQIEFHNNPSTNRKRETTALGFSVAGL